MTKLLNEVQDRFFRDNAFGTPSQELADLINEKFGLNLQVSQVKSYKRNNKIPSGLTGKFEKGHVPANKGQKFPGQINKTSFKKGQEPPNKMAVGSERVNGDDYVDIKIANPNIWKAKHKLIYEEFYGSVPAENVVIFADGDRRNFDIDNLIMISKKQLLVMNQHHLIKDDANFTRTGLIIADIKIKTAEIAKNIK